MIYLIFGEDTFRSRAKLDTIKQRFLRSHDPSNLVIKSGLGLADINLANLFLAQTLLGKNRLIILEDVLDGAANATKQTLVEFLSSPLPQDVTVVFYESTSFDARQKLFKLLNRPGYVQEFKPLAAAALLSQAQTMAQAKAIDISPQLLNYLLARIEGDLWRLHSELDKLAAFAAQQTVTQNHIDALTASHLDANIFALVNKLIGRDFKGAHQILQHSLDQGEDEIRLLGAIIYQLRSLVRVCDLQAQGLALSAIVQRTRLQPFVVKRCLQQTSRIEPYQLIAAYQHLVETDHQIKIGAMRSSDALDLLVANLADQFHYSAEPAVLV